jgi:hypothetical protein
VTVVPAGVGRSDPARWYVLGRRDTPYYLGCRRPVASDAALWHRVRLGSTTQRCIGWAGRMTGARSLRMLGVRTTLYGRTGAAPGRAGGGSRCRTRVIPAPRPGVPPPLGRQTPQRMGSMRGRADRKMRSLERGE